MFWLDGTGLMPNYLKINGTQNYAQIFEVAVNPFDEDGKTYGPGANLLSKMP
ncbi:hypothetical protein [Lactococcus cremoris]|uniref:hypothetical protein n=1 Tax=Lactococcus lactis subsp. cremoris TaxID=1359 RepID=UPI00163A21A3|nr:hypothetical protein [Lactococcus cremoris]